MNDSEVYREPSYREKQYDNQNSKRNAIICKDYVKEEEANNGKGRNEATNHNYWVDRLSNRRKHVRHGNREYKQENVVGWHAASDSSTTNN